MLVFCLASTTCTDPGIIPRRAILELNKDHPKCYIEGRHKDDPNADFAYCETCQIYRPARASHCSLILLISNLTF